MKPYMIFLLIALILVGLSNCGKQAKHGDQAESVTKYTCSMHPQIVEEKPGTCPICGMDLVLLTHSGEGSEIILSESQIRLANITTTMVRYEDFENSTLLTGRLVVDEEQTELISSRVSGRIEKLVIKETGKRVVQGQFLYEVYSEQLLTLENEYLLALKQAEAPGSQQKRYQSFASASEKKLSLLGLGPDQIKELRTTGIAQANARYHSPITGIVAQVDAAEGQYVSEGSELYRIESLDKIWVEADLYPSESALVTRGDVVDIEVAGFEGKNVKGKVTFLSPEYRAGSQIITLRAEIANKEKNFLPGMQGTVKLIRTTKKAIALPLDAVIRDERGSHVWVLNQNGAFVPRMVETGTENSERIEITAGLAEKENVAITGAYLLNGELVLKKGGDPMAGHSHL